MRSSDISLQLQGFSRVIRAQSGILHHQINLLKTRYLYISVQETSIVQQRKEKSMSMSPPCDRLQHEWYEKDTESCRVKQAAFLAKRVQKRDECVRQTCRDGQQGNARKFYEKVQRPTEDTKIKTLVCKNIKNEVESILRLQREQYSSPFRSSENNTPENFELVTPAVDASSDFPSPDQVERRIAITRRINKNAVLPAELFKQGGDKLTKCMHQLVWRICTKACPTIAT